MSGASEPGGVDGRASTLPSGQVPPLRLAPGTVLPPLAAAGLVSIAGVMFDDPREVVHYSVVLSLVAVAVVAQWKLPPYHSRLPVRVQIPLVLAMLAVTVPLLLDGTLRATHLLHLPPLPGLFPALFPRPVRERLIAKREERQRRREEERSAESGPTWQEWGMRPNA